MTTKTPSSGMTETSPRSKLILENIRDEENLADDILADPEPAPEAKHESAPAAASSSTRETKPSLDLPIKETVTLNTIQPPPESAPPARTAKSTPPKPAVTDTIGTPPMRATANTQGIEPIKTTPPVLFWGGMGFLSLLWASVSVVFILSAQSNLDVFRLEPFKLALLAIVALFPTGLIFASAFALREAAKLANESRRAARLADALVAPAAAAANQTLGIVESLKAQIDDALSAVHHAQTELEAMSQRLHQETKSLNEAATLAADTASNVTLTISREREALGGLSETLNAQAKSVIEAVDRQARMVGDASDLAQAQLREAEAALAARATDLSAVAADTHDTARAICEDLDKQTERLETAGLGVADQIRSVEENLSQQRAGLVSAALSLRADQEDFSVHLDSVRGQLTEALSITRLATVDLGDSSSRGMEAMRSVMQSAQEQFHQLLAATDNERTAFETRIHATLSNITMMAADARDDMINETQLALEKLNVAAQDARKAADAAAMTAQSRVDRLNESIFEASKKADEVFDARFNAARRLIEDSASLITEAGDQTADKLDGSFEKAREAIGDVHKALEELTHSANRLPLMAQERLFDIRKSVEDGILAMTAAARQAAQETETLDIGFQERVRKNYDMLTESVRLMGILSGGQPLSGTRAAPQPMPAPFTAPTRKSERASAERPSKASPEPLSQAPETSPQPEKRVEKPAVEKAPERAPERPSRLRLSPIESDPVVAPEPAPTPAPRPAPKAPSDPAPVIVKAPASDTPRPSVGDSWSWRDVLNNMDGGAPSVAAPQPAAPAFDENVYDLDGPMPPHDPEFDRLDDMMIGELASLNVDLNVLLGHSRIKEVIEAMLAEDNEGARSLVRRVAPSIVRRLGKRMGTDTNLRTQAMNFVEAYDRQIDLAVMSKHASDELNGLLANDSGRAYLLFDAAIGELG